MFALFRTDVFKTERFDLDYSAGAADLDYAIRAALKGPLYYVRERLGEYRAHDCRTTATQTSWIRRGLAHIFEKYSFDDTAHEELRVRLLLDAYRSTLLDASTKDRMQWRGDLQRYRKLGGASADTSVVLSYLLTALPHAIGRPLHTVLRNVRRRVAAITETRQSGEPSRRHLVEGRYRDIRRAVAALALWPSAYRRFGRRAVYLTWARTISGWTTTEEAAALMQAVTDLPDNPIIVEVGFVSASQPSRSQERASCAAADGCIASTPSTPRGTGSQSTTTGRSRRSRTRPCVSASRRTLRGRAYTTGAGAPGHRGRRESGLETSYRHAVSRRRSVPRRCTARVREFSSIPQAGCDGGVAQLHGAGVPAWSRRPAPDRRRDDPPPRLYQHQVGRQHHVRTRGRLRTPG